MEGLLTKVEYYSVENYYKLGMPRNTDLNRTLCLITKSKKAFKVHYHTFDIVAREDKK